MKFKELDLKSGAILNKWLDQSGVSRTTVLKEINQSQKLQSKIGYKTFQQWTSSGESSKRVSGRSLEEAGFRIVEIVRWFYKEHLHRRSGLMTTQELRKLIQLYEDLPVANRLQLQRLLHDLEVANGERNPDLPVNPDWKMQMQDQPLCAFVMDKFWCLRATTHYELAFAGFSEEDLKNWGCWHRLTASVGNVPKYAPGSPMRVSRGPYAREYYVNQMFRFRHGTASLIKNHDPRMLQMLELLNESPQFQETWELSLSVDRLAPSNTIGFPVPFFRKDDTLLWMMELSVEIANSGGLNFVHWTPMSRDANLYIADFCDEVDKSKRFSKTCYFIDDFASYFTERQRLALGLAQSK